MSMEFKVISGGGQTERTLRILTQEEKIRHYQNVTEAVLDDALNTWSEIWREFQGTVTDASLVLPEAEKGFKPECGWSEFLEKIWLLKHYLDYARKFTRTGI